MGGEKSSKLKKLTKSALADICFIQRGNDCSFPAWTREAASTGRHRTQRAVLNFAANQNPFRVKKKKYCLGFTN